MSSNHYSDNKREIQAKQECSVKLHENIMDCCVVSQRSTNTILNSKLCLSRQDLSHTKIPQEVSEERLPIQESVT